MDLPSAIAEILTPQFGAVREITRVEGGMMNRAARVEFESQTLFVKWSETAPPGLYAAEAQGLDALRATQTFVVPAVAALDEKFLALQWLDNAPHDADDCARVFAESLVALHRAPAQAQFGWPRDNYLGEFAQPNRQTDDWPAFYAENRLIPQLEHARKNGHLPSHREALLRRACAAIPQLCDDLEARPCLIHGDLWAGNFLSLKSSHVALVDPAVYCAPREMELAYIELFGGFPIALVPTYRELWPLPAGYEKRRALWQLYPLLVHLNAFGETYGALVERACLQTLANRSRKCFLRGVRSPAKQASQTLVCCFQSFSSTSDF